MRIKEARTDDSATWARRALVALDRRRVFMFLALAIYGMLALTAGLYLHSSGVFARLRHSTSLKLDIVRRQNVHLLGRMGRGMSAEPEQLLLSMKFENFKLLELQRDRAMAVGVLNSTSQDYVPATLEHNRHSIPIRIRLKGDLTDHLAQGQKWSFRIQTKGDRTFWGMKQFSLQHPDTRNFVYEWIFHRALLREGILGLRYDFVRLKVNGRDLGVYAIEEHFEKRLVEHNRRREGPIVRFSEERLWDEWLQQKAPFPGARQNGGGSFLASAVDAFGSQDWNADPQAREIHDKALWLLDSFRNGEKQTREVFDLHRMALFLAITDLMGAEHGARWHNMRFYYNPVTSRLEPIGFDGDSGQPLSQLVYHMKDAHWSKNAWSSDSSYFKLLFADPELVRLYMEALDRVSRPGYLDELLAEIAKELDDKLRIIYMEDPSFEFSKDVLYRNQRYIRSVLEPSVALSVFARHANPGAPRLRLGNLQALPVEVSGVMVRERRIDLNGGTLLLPGREPTALVAYHNVDLRLPSDVAWPADSSLADVKIRYRVHGTTKELNASATAWPHADEMATAEVTRKPANVDHFEFLTIDMARRTIHISPGTWTVGQDLVVPAGYKLRCGPGTRLQLEHASLLLSRSPLEFIGTETDPIVITSTDGTGQGVVVLEADGESALEYVVFQGLRFPSRQGWTLTGAVTFYESPVSIRYCQFLDSHAEDALNTIRTRFRVLDSAFVGTESDAFDADFCVGEVRRTRFSRCRNDGIDVSGSNVEIEAVEVVSAGDKGMSVGENSQVRAAGVSVGKSRLGIAIKDLSTLEAKNVRISDTRFGCAAYRKKPEFGPGKGTISDLVMTSVSTAYLIEIGSMLVADGKEIRGDGTGIAAWLDEDLKKQRQKEAQQAAHAEVRKKDPAANATQSAGGQVEATLR